MFLLLAVALAAAGFAHGALARSPLAKRVELALVYLVAGYFGLVMLVVALFCLVAPERAAAMLGADPGSPFELFLGWAYCGMAVAALLAVRLRGAYLVGPIVAWSLDLFGAVQVHWVEYSAAGSLSSRFAAFIVLEHAGPPLVAIALGTWLWRLSRSSPPGGSGRAPTTSDQAGIVTNEPSFRT